MTPGAPSGVCQPCAPHSAGLGWARALHPTHAATSPPSPWKCHLVGSVLGRVSSSRPGTRPSSSRLDVWSAMLSRGEPRPPRPLTVSGRIELCSSLAGSVLLTRCCSALFSFYTLTAGAHPLGRLDVSSPCWQTQVCLHHIPPGDRTGMSHGRTRWGVSRATPAQLVRSPRPPGIRLR